MARNQRHSVGIFSRDGEPNYKWLINLLRSIMFQSIVEDVLPIYISSDTRSFYSALSQTSFAILYHTKKRGRLNIANVTDSLYDQELEDLSSCLGRSNVVVLLDDLEDSSDTVMERIIQEQRLDTHACEVILISKREKESSNLSGADPRFSQSPIAAQMQDHFNSLYDKLRRLKGIIGDAPYNKAGPGTVDNYATTPVSSHSIESRDTASERSSRQSGSGLLPPPQPSGPVLIEVNNSPQEFSNLLNRNPLGVLQAPNNNTDGKVQRDRKKDKMVFGIIGGLIALLLIVLIIVLCTTL
ncbi:uncharacterized protein [Dendropsophus ebraccatus]|uniref:uncharacterized protein isoform X2 n=1 Tax=Dendropsophus ebraccatus TaxID=150705 RepID=UPI003831ADE9